MSFPDPRLNLSAVNPRRKKKNNDFWLTATEVVFFFFLAETNRINSRPNVKLYLNIAATNSKKVNSHDTRKRRFFFPEFDTPIFGVEYFTLIRVTHDKLLYDQTTCKKKHNSINKNVDYFLLSSLNSNIKYMCHYQYIHISSWPAFLQGNPYLYITIVKQ